MTRTGHLSVTSGPGGGVGVLQKALLPGEGCSGQGGQVRKKEPEEDEEYTEHRSKRRKAEDVKKILFK